MTAEREDTARAEGRAEVTAAVEAVCAEEERHGGWRLPLTTIRAALADPGDALAAVKAEAWRDALEYAHERHDEIPGTQHHLHGAKHGATAIWLHEQGAVSDWLNDLIDKGPPGDTAGGAT